jgi:hypothetical protein
MSEKQSQTSRINGAKSSGPVTPEGRAASSQNALRHGLRSQQIVLPTESQDEFQQLHDHCIAQFQPQGGYEQELVQTIAVARWRFRRLMLVDSKLMAVQLALSDDDIEREFDNITAEGRTAYVFRKLANQGLTLPLVLRYEGAINRTHDRALKHLQALQAARRQQVPNEPAAPPHPEPPPPLQQKQPFEPEPGPSAGGQAMNGPPLETKQGEGSNEKETPAPSSAPRSPLESAPGRHRRHCLLPGFRLRARNRPALPQVPRLHHRCGWRLPPA